MLSSLECSLLCKHLSQRDFITMKKVKNDSIDAYVIAELIATGKYKESHISSESYHTLKV